MECGSVELSGVVLMSEFIEVIQCGRLGRLEQPFHFVPSLPPSPATAFVSQVVKTAPGPPQGAGPGRVVLSFQSADIVGVMVTSSHLGWSSVAPCSYRAFRGQHARATSSDDTSPTLSDDLFHLEIQNSNFSRSADFISLGERGLVEFVQLNAQHQPQLIWYRPLLRTASPWG